MEKKAIFLGVTKFHSNKNNADYRKVDFCVPPYKTEDGFIRGGVVSAFTPFESVLGDDIKFGSIVVPVFDYDPCSTRAQLTDIKPVKATPYKAEDFS